jgi:2-succinyl-5-enolpyruvyl-6-hydroxy-3-cyclohexene-1-carboxylate synthase
LFLGNSSAIRSFNVVKLGEASEVERVFANRGVSGIEGHIATTLGIADNSSVPIVTVLGDISAMHDLGSFLALGKSKQPVCVVLLNDKGGGIFRRLKISESQYQTIMPFLVTPHEFEFGPIADMAGIDYAKVGCSQDLLEGLQAFWQQRKTKIIECTIDHNNESKAWQLLLREEK